MATISLRAVPIQTVAPSAERSALEAAGTEICAIRVWLAVGKNFDTVHRAVGDEDVLVGEIVDDVAMMGFTEGSVGG